ncbi:MAG: energy-coupling factor ABC transporter ATP-binding protein [Oscillospiraceae bacterium]|nr:energy-coupling factor ABC transporter ATP-binding protein [Oscillospiraceae bacterium]
MLEIKNLTVKYDLSDKSSNICALDNVGFSVKDGEKIALIGANGAGKSTLLLTLSGVLTAANGEIYIDGIKSDKKNLKELRRKIGMVFQNPDDQIFMPTVYDDIAFGPRNYGEIEEEIEHKTDEILTNLEITHLKNRLTHKLSGGEKRLVALAGILIMNPSVILMDEPSSFLDPKARRRLINILDKLPQTMIIATHDLDMALDLCERVILLKNGSVRADSSAKEILYDANVLDECGLELPISVLAKNL